MQPAACRYCGVEIEVSGTDLPEGVVRLGTGVAHDACVFARESDPRVGNSAASLERDYQQARARGPISAG